MTELNERSLEDALRVIESLASAAEKRVGLKPTYFVPRVIPIAQLYQKLIDRHCKPSVIARVLKLNPDGVMEGCIPRGHRHRPTMFTDDFITPQKLINDHGIEAYRAMDKQWWKMPGHGRHKRMSRVVYLDNEWKFRYHRSFEM